jgi:hypothetical protein
VLSLSPTERAYIAAVIDGDGTISINKVKRRHKTPQYRPKVRVVNTDIRLIEYFTRLIGRNNFYVCYRKPRPSRQPTFEIQFKESLIPFLLEQIKEYLVIKKKQAELVIAFCNTYSSHWGCNGVADSIVEQREKIYREIQRLNKRGRITS